MNTCNTNTPNNNTMDGPKPPGQRGIVRRLSLGSMITRDNPMVSNIEVLAQKRGVNTAEERFKVTPDYAYPNARMNREELRREMNKKSCFFHTLRLSSEPEGVGQVSLEILQCFGLPKPDSTLGSEASAFCIAVCGAHAFRTDTMPPVANPMWLSRMRRTCIFPIFHAYARVYIGVFGNQEGRRDGFAGRIVIDIARLRPDCTYDITLPLRRSAHVYEREQRGAIRCRIHLHWFNERKAILSYLPEKIPKIKPNNQVTVRCCDAKSFQNVARVVHGEHMPGRFNVKQMQATVREINLTQIQLLRYVRKREFRNLTQWRVPLISAFLFGSWMHCVYTESITYVPGHFITLLLLYLWKNYAFYRLDPAMQNGFVAPSWEEMFLALLFGRPKTIEPLQMEAAGMAKSAIDDMNAANATTDDQQNNDFADGGRHADLIQTFRSEIRLRCGRQNLRLFHHVFKGSEAVDFLLTRRFADTREEAVELAEKLRTQERLFEDVVSTKQSFKDDHTLYRFVDHDTCKYTIKTHIPWGKRWFRLIGLVDEIEPNVADCLIEMPYSNGIDHPRLTVKEALVIRSRESMKMLEDEQQGNGKEKSNSQQLAEGLDALLDDDRDKSVADKTMESSDLQSLDDDPDFEVNILPKPPQQDINYRPPKSGKSLTEILAETRHKMHAYLMHAFNDRVYPETVWGHSSLPKKKISHRLKVRGGAALKKMFGKRKRTLSEDSIPDQKIDPRAFQDENDRLVGIGKYSHPNPWISRVGVIVQPMMEMMLGFLCMFRALFNIFTWRDPILTFWVSVIGPVLVVVLHLFPWRIVMGIVGLVLFGPQNWILRVYRERKYGPDEFDPDKIVKKRKESSETEEDEVPLFSMDAPNNSPVSNENIDSSVIRKVVVPYSQLMYQRFYDFPPETEYARVIREGPPRGFQLDDGQFSRECSFASGSQHSGSEGRGLINSLRVRRGRRRKSQDSTSSGEELFK